MPIYGYSCSACGHQKDVLQKMSDPALTQCPSCGAETFSRQVSAPAFQLKGTGWYVTDFRDNGKGGKGGNKDSKPDDANASASSKDSGNKEAAASTTESKASTDTAKSPDSKTPASPAPSPAPAASSASKSS